MRSTCFSAALHGITTTSTLRSCAATNTGHWRRLGDAPPDGVRYLDPTIQLLFKADNPRSKDIADFNAVLAALPRAKRAWLAQCAERHPSPPSLAGTTA